MFISRVVVGVVFISWRGRLLPASLTEPDPFSVHSSPSLYTGVVLFFSSFSWKTSASSRAKHARENTTLRWRSINPPRFIFYHPRSTDSTLFPGSLSYPGNEVTTDWRVCEPPAVNRLIQSPQTLLPNPPFVANSPGFQTMVMLPSK